MPYTRDQIRQANKELHAALANEYKASEPHYRPENVRRVRDILSDLRARTAGTRLLDLGCGAGFVIDIAREVFATVRGVDICEEMLCQINTTAGDDVEVMTAAADNTPYDDGTFDVCTAYAVLHHLDALAPTFGEAYRVLRPGGVLYTDLDPNACFWEALRSLPPNGTYSPIVRREIDAVLHKGEELRDKFGIAPELLHTAEYLKHDAGGFEEEELRTALRAAGFSRIDVRYEWFLGEGQAIHGQSPQVLAALREYMQDLLPLSRHLFKYVVILAEK